MSSSEVTDNHAAEALALGQQAARNAASWCVDGNSDPDAIRRTLAMLDDGDPEAYDRLPKCPDLSGEWADDPTPLSLARDILGTDDPSPEAMDVLAEAFEAGVAMVFEAECERIMREAVR